MKKILLLALLLTGCFTDPGDARRALENQGFTDIKIGEYDYWECGKEDATGISFTATNPLGKQVSGVVCCGQIGKGCTVRW